MVASRAFGPALSVCLTVLAAQSVTAGYLIYRQGHQRLSPPGVTVVSLPVFGEKGQLVATNRVELPPVVLNFDSTNLPIEQVVLDWLPKDTTFGQRLYKAPDGFQAKLSVVLMGTDRTSIHKPQYCLEGTGWHIDKSEILSIPILEPVSYSLPVMRLTATHDIASETGQKGIARGLYVYWFVSEDQLSADHDERMFWMGVNMLRTGVLKRWAYVGCFAMCAPGQEEATYARMQELIIASVPKFQSVNHLARLARK